MDQKSENTATGIFKVNGWGCDSLMMKANIPITRSNSKGDPSNTGEFLMVHTNSKSVSFRFESEGTWTNVPAKTDKLFVRIPSSQMGEKLIFIEVIYTPS